MSIISFQPHTLFELKKEKNANLQEMSHEHSVHKMSDENRSEANLSGPTPNSEIPSPPDEQKQFKDYKFKIVNQIASNLDETAEKEYMMNEETKLKQIVSPTETGGAYPNLLEIEIDEDLT